MPTETVGFNYHPRQARFGKITSLPRPRYHDDIRGVSSVCQFRVETNTKVHIHEKYFSISDFTNTDLPMRVVSNPEFRIDPTRVGDLAGDTLMNVKSGTIHVPEGCYVVRMSDVAELV